MGRDIHLNIIKKKEFLAENIFDGRNSDWFNNLTGQGVEDEYDYFPRRWSIPDEAPDKITDAYNNSRDYGYFDFFYVNVKEFKDWYVKYIPYLKAGWVNTYDKWRIEKKGYIPDELPHYLPEEYNPNDVYFIEYEDKYDCSRWLYNYLNEHDIPNDADIVYYFDA